MTSHFTGTTKAEDGVHGKQRLKRCVFRRLRKTGSEGADVTCGGRPFQMRRWMGKPTRRGTSHQGLLSLSLPRLE